MEQLPCQIRPNENQTGTEISENNSKTINPCPSQLSAKTDQTGDTNHKENIKITDQSLSPPYAKDNEKGHTALSRNNSKGNFEEISKLASDASNKPQLIVETQKNQEFPNTNAEESKTSSALNEVKTNHTPSEGSKRSSLPRFRKNTPTARAATKTTIPKNPVVNKCVTNISLPSNAKNGQKQSPQQQNLHSSSKLCLNKTKTTSSDINKKNLLTSSGQTVPNAYKKSASNASSRSMPFTKKEDPQTNLRKKISFAGDHNVIERLEKNLEKVQTEFLHNIENVKLCSPEKLKCDYKLITMVKNNQCKLIIEDDTLRELPRKLPANSVNDFKEKIKNVMDNWFMCNTKDSSKSASVNVESLTDELERQKILNDIFSHFDELCSGDCEDTSDSQIVKIQIALKESNNALKKAEKKLVELSEQHDDHVLKLKNEFKAKADDNLAHKNAEINELNKKIKSFEKQKQMAKIAFQATEKEYAAEIVNLQDKLKSSNDDIASLNKKLHTMEQQLSNEKKDLKNKSEQIKKLESDLMEMTKNVQELKALSPATNDCPEHVRQIAELQNVVNSLENDKVNMKQKIDKLEAESSVIIELNSKLKEAESQVKDLKKKLEEKLPEATQDCVKDLQLELSKSRQLDEEKRCEIDTLKNMLSKYQLNIYQLNEQVQRDQQLLKVRSELITSLQTNEKSQRGQMDELYLQVGEKNNIINELQSELQVKSEEFKNLFSTFSSKQMELTNKDHIIKLLEESNERSQMLRVKQEEKIGRMEEELTHLKQTINIYQANILSDQDCKSLLFAPMLPPSNMDCNENFYYYRSQRKRKRQNDIVVKKYEV